MTTFLLIRHGETAAVGKVLAGWTPGWHLNHAGRMQVRRLAEELSKLPLRAVYTSPLERALETAEPIAAGHGLEPQIVKEFGELHFGDWEGRLIAELEPLQEWQHYNAHRGWTRPPGGELLHEVQGRVLRRLECLRTQHGGETVAVVSHGDPLRALVCHCLGIPLELVSRFEISPASVSVIELDSWGPRVLCLNGTGDMLR